MLLLALRFFLTATGSLITVVRGGRVISVGQLRMISGAASAIRDMNRLGCFVIVVTNQGAIAKGILTPAELERIHSALRARLKRSGAIVDAIYHCPHHEKGMVDPYVVACECRKPGTGMIRQAAKDFNIDMKNSFMVGDTTGDMLTGNRAGVRTVLVRTGYAGMDGLHPGKPDFIVKSLLHAVPIIKKHLKNL